MAEITFSSIPDDAKIKYCIDIIEKEARLENRLIKQIFYTMLSMYTNDPGNLAINAPTGEGKNYIIRKVVDLFPKEDVIVLSGMTEKALFHRNGILVIKNELGEYESIEDRFEEIDSTIEDKEAEIARSQNKLIKQALKAQIGELEKEKKNLYKDAKKLVDLSHKTLIFLDTPPEGLFSAIMSLLSHDNYESEYNFVDTNNGIKTHSNVLRGWPVVIFAQAVDYSYYKRYPEIQRRFVITNPKMDREKYAAAIDLMCDKYGLPDFMYQDEIVSDLQKEQAREIIRGIKEKILDVSTCVKPGSNNTFIPFRDAIKSSLPKERTSDMTIAGRILGYLTLLSSINIENRPVIRLRKKGSPITQTIPLSTFEDLKEAVYLVRYANGVRPYVLDWYYDVFLKRYNEETEPKSKLVSKDHVVHENRKAVTSEELSDATYRLTNKKLSTKKIKETYLDQLINEGYVDQETSELSRNRNIYYPVVETTTSNSSTTSLLGQSTTFLEQTKIIVENTSIFPSKDYIISKIRAILNSSIAKGFVQTNNFDIEEIVDIYYNNPDECFEVKEVKNNAVQNPTGIDDFENGQNLEKSDGNKADNIDISISETDGCNNVVDTQKKDIVDDFNPITWASAASSDSSASGRIVGKPPPRSQIPNSKKKDNTMEVIKKDTWPEQKEKFYPSEPVIQLGEMDFETMYPWGKPKEETKKEVDDERAK